MQKQKYQLSEVHAEWLETERQLPAELAASLGVVSIGQDLAFSYMRSGGVAYWKVRKQLAGGDKTYRIDPAGQKQLFWNEDVLDNPSLDARLIICEGELDAVAFASVGEIAMSVPNGGAEFNNE